MLEPFEFLSFLISARLKILIYKNQAVQVHSIDGLDSFMKKIPDLRHLEIAFETVNAKPET